MLRPMDKTLLFDFFSSSSLLGAGACAYIVTSEICLLLNMDNIVALIVRQYQGENLMDWVVDMTFDAIGCLVHTTQTYSSRCFSTTSSSRLVHHKLGWYMRLYWQIAQDYRETDAEYRWK